MIRFAMGMALGLVIGMAAASIIIAYMDRWR